MNEMITQVLNALKPLVAYGFYWNISTDIIGDLVFLINGSKDQFICMQSIIPLYSLVCILCIMFPGDKEGKVASKNEKNKLLYQLKTT